eukprot:TRINITY_DN21984_c0_g1_i1.p2 TRINITY_DN21984_c0_g1~~TRINITY_DN21984_c0_g1_i1.p2  ORF type:complete len:257 (+),score=49.95 TRINITY_DN21984_c0_g1_i1:89-772(+)
MPAQTEAKAEPSAEVPAGMKLQKDAPTASAPPDAVHLLTLLLSFSRSDWSKPGYMPAQTEAKAEPSAEVPAGMKLQKDAPTASAPPGVPQQAASETGGLPTQPPASDSLGAPAGSSNTAPAQPAQLPALKDGAVSEKEAPPTTSGQGPAVVAGLPDDSGAPNVEDTQPTDASRVAANVGDIDAAVVVEQYVGGPADSAPGASGVQGADANAADAMESKDEELDDVTL